MASRDHLARIKKGVNSWNSWRAKCSTTPNLRGASLVGLNLQGANLSQSNLANANLYRVDLEKANLKGATLTGAFMEQAHLRQAILASANLKEANLCLANLNLTDLTHADLRRANLSGALLASTILDSANLTGCFVYGVSAWDLKLDDAIQSDLVITEAKSPVVTVDNLEVAQFIYLLLNNQKIRHVIDTITSKVVLILGRFTAERKAVLDAIRNELRNRDYLPVLFDFDKPSNRDITETVSTLAHMARFVIADITAAKSIPQELMKIVPALPSVPVQPILLASEHEWSMFKDLLRYPWVLEPYMYEDQDGLLAAITDKVIGPAEKKAKEQTGK